MRSSGVVVLLVCAAAALLLPYWSTLLSLHERWWTTESQYSHGYLMVALVLWLLWERREALAAAPLKPYWPALVLPLGGSLLWLLSDLVQVQIVQQLVLPALVWGWLLSVAGWPLARLLLVPVAFVYFAIPVWDFLVPPLREITVVVNSVLLDLAGIPAFIEGTYVTLSVGTFYVADGCSGLSYMLTSLLLAAVYGTLYMRSWSRRLALTAISLAMGLVCNWARVFGLVLVGHWTNMESEMIADHGLYGWFIFAFMLLPYLYVARRLEDGEPDSADSAGAASKPDVRALVAAAVVAGAAGIAGPALLALVPQAGTGGDLSWPQIAGWQTAAERRLGFEPRFVGFDERHTQTYVAGDGNGRVEALTLVYRTQRQGKELVSDLNRIAPEQRTVMTRTLAPEVSGLEHGVSETLVDGGRQLVLVWSWYQLGERTTTRAVEAKLLQVATFLQGGGARLVTVASDCVTESCTGTRERLAAVAAAL